MAEVPAEMRALADQLVANGARPILIETSDPDHPFVMAKAVRVEALSAYLVAASGSNTLQGAIGIARTSFVSLIGAELEAVIARKPLFVLRVVQALLRDHGLGTRAEKKSLS